MRLPLLPMLLVLIINLAIDIYLYRVAKRRCRHKWPAVLQAVSAFVGPAMVATAIGMLFGGNSNSVLVAVMWLLYIYFSIYVPKLIVVVADLLSLLPRLWHARRWRGVTVGGCLLALIVFGFFWWSALVTRNSIKVNEVTVEVADLPASFDGYRIAQFSDIHVGTFGTDTTFVAKAVNRINSLGANLIVFTGDIVNRRTDELSPHATPLSRLTAPDGVLSILGNHDYGDYAQWPTSAHKAQSMQQLYALQRGMGWTLLRDSTVWISRGADSLAIIGVENIGEAPFPTYGSLRKAYPCGVDDHHAKVLLTHNPRHWTDSIAPRHDANIALTLSGHTHAMQVMVVNWSPAKYRYDTWRGLYTTPDHRHLYVNIGLGEVGIPARIGGATPEITLITLRNKTQE